MTRSAILLALLLGFAHSAVAQIAVVQRNVNLRPDPSSSQTAIRKLHPHEEVVLVWLAKTSNYYNVRTERGEVGWIWANNVDVEDRLPNWDTANIPDYDRAEWKHWVDADGDCQDTRDEVLVRDADGPITFKTSGRCDVESGTWVDPYRSTLTNPSDVDIDHMVPLRNAHVSGAWAWTKERKEAYANELIDPQHLLAVDDGLNQSKGSRGPEEWLPPNSSFWCEYATIWERVKTHWRLSMSTAETAKVEQVLATCGI